MAKNTKVIILPNALSAGNLREVRNSVQARHRPFFTTPAPRSSLKLHADSISTFLAVTAYGDDHVAVNGEPYRRSLLLQPGCIDAKWGPDVPEDLTEEHLATLAGLPCDVLLLGTGPRQKFPSPALLRPLIEAGCSIEIMDTPAACRTYNILAAEGRTVAAALIIAPRAD